VERLAAEPGSKEWGRLGVLTQLQCEVEKLFEVPPEAFYPPPKVQSAVVRLTPRQTSPYPRVHLPDLQRLVTQAFSQRRKTLRNNFKGRLKPPFNEDARSVAGLPANYYHPLSVPSLRKETKYTKF